MALSVLVHNLVVEGADGLCPWIAQDDELQPVVYQVMTGENVWREQVVKRGSGLTDTLWAGSSEISESRSPTNADSSVYSDGTWLVLC